MDNKQFLTVDEQIKHLKNKGISFENYSEEKAKQYLRYNNNLFKLSSFRKNYDKYQGGVNDGKYINLNFEHLVDLSIIDMTLRYTVIQLSLDIEHYTKLELLRLMEDNNEDGYTIYEDYISSLSSFQREILNKEITRNNNSVYNKNLLNRYKDNIPIWVFLEIISFGQLLSFYLFCAERYDLNEMKNKHFLLTSSKELRNASAHNSCIFNNLRPKTSMRSSRHIVMKQLSAIRGLSHQTRVKRMSNDRIQQITTLLYSHITMVTSEGVHKKACLLLQSFKNRLEKNIDYYKDNELIFSNIVFLVKIIDTWFKTM
jgi:hypothetical protein